MSTDKNIAWFKENVEPKLRGYEVKYNFFEKGDFGSLNQVEFNSELKGGSVDFWSLGWIGIHLIDYTKEEELINLLIEPSGQEKINESLENLIRLL